MSQDNVELVQSLSAAWERGDMSAMIEGLDPVGLDMYARREQALEAVGLRE